MVQEIISYLIIMFAVLYTIYGTVKLFLPSKQKAGCECAASCSGCDLKNKTSVSIKISNIKF